MNFALFSYTHKTNPKYENWFDLAKKIAASTHLDVIKPRFLNNFFSKTNFTET